MKIVLSSTQARNAKTSLANSAIATGLMVGGNQDLFVLKDKPLDSPNLMRLDAGGRSQGDRFEPELAFSVRSSNVDMRRLGALIGIEVKSERSDAKNRGHTMEARRLGRVAQARIRFAERRRSATRGLRTSRFPV
jgi:hypothetical protein